MVRYIYMVYWPSERSRWLDIGQAVSLSCQFDRTTSPKKDLIFNLRENFSCSRWSRVEKGAGGPHLSRARSQSQRQMFFILPAHGASHIVRTCKMDHWNNDVFPTTCYLLTLGWFVLLVIKEECCPKKTKFAELLCPNAVTIATWSKGEDYYY